MAAHAFNTANAARVPRSIGKLGLLLGVVFMFPAVAMGVTAIGLREPRILLPLSLVAILFAALHLTYATGYKRLLLTLDETGLTVRFLRTLRLEWREIRSVERIAPKQVVNWRLCGLGAPGLLHGLFSLAGGGTAWVWLADENEALLLRTTRRNYVIAPELIDEADRLIRQRISAHV